MWTEEKEQIKLATYLDSKGYVWFHVPNGGHSHKVGAAKMKRAGQKRGAPDCILISGEGGAPLPRPIAIELKRVSGGSLSKHQKYFLGEMKRCGWDTLVAKGSRAAIDWLVEKVEKAANEEKSKENE